MIKHIGTYENENGYCEVYFIKDEKTKSEHYMAGSPTNNTVLPLFDNGKVVSVNILDYCNEHAALEDLIDWLQYVL